MLRQIILWRLFTRLIWLTLFMTCSVTYAFHRIPRIPIWNIFKRGFQNVVFRFYPTAVIDILIKFQFMTKLPLRTPTYPLTPITTTTIPTTTPRTHRTININNNNNNKPKIPHTKTTMTRTTTPVEESLKMWSTLQKLETVWENFGRKQLILLEGKCFFM